jgi:predicted  nucleic acid-binding Zn-ribbon protein
LYGVSNSLQKGINVQINSYAFYNKNLSAIKPKGLSFGNKSELQKLQEENLSLKSQLEEKEEIISSQKNEIERLKSDLQFANERKEHYRLQATNYGYQLISLKNRQ